MPPTTVHFNGGVNLVDAETVMREIASRVPSGIRRIPDGETGDRQQWIFYQLQKFWQTPGLEEVGTSDPTEGYEALPKVRLADGADPDALSWPNLGYADAYQESFKTFQQLRKEGILAADVRFQVQYPTPLASIVAWLTSEDQERIEPSYERALFADLDRLLAALPHDEIAVQWDVAVELGMLVGGFPITGSQTFDSIIERLARCADRVPADVPIGMHLCYGDYQHRHFKEPDSLELQVRIANGTDSMVHRTVNWYSFTVPQDQREPAFFAPLRNLRAGEETELYFALVPYHPTQQQPGTTGEQVRLIDECLGRDAWGICTECGMARAEPEEVPVLLDQHREILASYA